MHERGYTLEIKKWKLKDDRRVELRNLEVAFPRYGGVLATLKGHTDGKVVVSLTLLLQEQLAAATTLSCISLASNA